MPLELSLCPGGIDNIGWGMKSDSVCAHYDPRQDTSLGLSVPIREMGVIKTAPVS